MISIWVRFVWGILSTFGIQATGKQIYFCFPKLIKKGVRSVVVFSTPGTWDAVIQISCPLAQFQMSFASLLQETKIVPPFLLMYARAVVLSSFSNTCSLVSFFQKAFKQKKPAFNSREFMRHFFSIEFHLPQISNTWFVPPQPSKLASEKSVTSKLGILNLNLNFIFKFICCFLWDIIFPVKITTRSSQAVLCIFPIPCNTLVHVEEFWTRTLSLLWFALVLWLLLGNLKGYTGKVYKWIVSFPYSELLSFLQSLSQTLGILSVV